jgi:hypothetical protein
MTSDNPGCIEECSNIGVGDAHQAAKAMSLKAAGCDEALDGSLGGLEDFRCLGNGAKLTERASGWGRTNGQPSFHAPFGWS